jgi:hypothetical protein
MKIRRKRVKEQPEVSYLAVSMDLPEEAVIIPERKRTWTEVDPTFRYITAERVPIYGPVTKRESHEEARILERRELDRKERAKQSAERMRKEELVKREQEGKEEKN